MRSLSRWSAPASTPGSRKWFMPPTPRTGSRIQAPTHDPRIVVNTTSRIVGNLELALDQIYRRSWTTCRS